MNHTVSEFLKFTISQVQPIFFTEENKKATVKLVLKNMSFRRLHDAAGNVV